ncbi:circularly permuted type 2 ATP-grasp protein [uncultured Cohaesibacter sp.]|uniref:circularly permuted type 2 ATP-grasp protein n=1 Tax=uncultured Cohaesibacter sp. TaxID=1002546 RepID=UPI002AAB666A|nr:circularly permuted type 2 ATP-grasp protein [uncultured Cohaesibacter sp.]
MKLEKTSDPKTRLSGNTAEDGMQPPAGAPMLYQTLPGIHDEMMDADGSIMPHWQQWFDAFSRWSPSDRSAHWDELNEVVRETGIAYDLFADPNDARQPWSIDLAPLIIAPEEWQWLKVALAQRARLFNAMHNDLYGHRRLLHEGYIPAALVMSDPSYLRPMRGNQSAYNGVQFFAADLAKAPDGNWRVLDNHAETPAGLGFALANRIALTHCEGNLFRSSKAVRLASYFQQLQSTLVKRTELEDPYIAILSPGPEHPDYFSHAYLARYLGYLLVEGGDLVYQNNRICLKTLAGLKPIDLIVRSIEGLNADPLELNPNGMDGTTSMVQAIRDKGIIMANQLGTSIVENRALAPYLPEICRFLLGEDLMLREAERWWLGDPTSRSHVLANLDDMLISDAHEGSGRPGEARPATDPAKLSEAERKDLIDKIHLFGNNLVAEKKTGYATTPSWSGETLEPRPFAIRFYGSRKEQGYEILPGGLSMSVGEQHAIGLHSPEGLTRDVWVVSDAQPEPFESIWASIARQGSYSRAGRSLQSRIADNLFWLGRNVERIEWQFRLCRQALSRLNEDSGPEEDQRTVVSALNTLILRAPKAQVFDAGFGGMNEIERLVRTVLYGKNRAYGFQESLAHMHRLTGLTRDRMSSDAWRILNEFFTDHRWFKEPGFMHTGHVIDLLDKGLMVLAAFSGMAMENMTRNYGWRFLDIGRRIERAENLSGLLNRLIFAPGMVSDAPRRLMFILEVADSFITYRSRYRITPTLPAVIDLLLLDETNPRSIAFQIAALHEHVNYLPKEPESGLRSEENRLILELLTDIQLSEGHKLAQIPQFEQGKDIEQIISEECRLEQLLNNQISKLPQLTELLTRRYFTHTEEQAQRI